METKDPNDIWAGITLCAAHPSDADTDCDYCQNEMTARGAVIEQMQAEAAHRLKGLSQSGVDYPTYAIDHIRLELLIEVMIGGRNSYLFEGEAGRRVIEHMKVLQRETTRQTLAPEKRLTVINNGRPGRG